MNIQYVFDEYGQETAVIMPIALWHELMSEKETAYLLKSQKMRERLLESKNRQTGIPFEEITKKFGI
jgi:PHD/YefM family antitoxin component YafN of YafNO toxin-antitoxin module